jgi:predicted 2-oxoglutarate/Fe(II)-dependent dioxygenase YbiX
MSKLADSLQVKDYVVTFKQLLSTETCKKIIEWAEQQPDADNAWDGWETAKSAVSNTKNEVTDHRICHMTMLNENRGPCWDSIKMALHHIVEDYPYAHKITGHTGVSLIRYGEGHKFEEHIDHYGGAQRILSVSIILNEEYTGGELSFWQGKYQVPNLNAGDAVVFPSNFVFPHEVKPVKLGTRYALIVWFN